MFKKIRKISTKLIMVFMAVALVASIAGVVGAVMLKVADTQYSAALVDYGFSQGYLGRLGMIVNENRALTRDIVFLTDKAQLDAAYTSIQQNAAATTPLLDAIRPTNTSPEARDLFAKIEKDLSDYTAVRDQVLELGMQNKMEPAYELWTGTASPIVNQIAADVTTLLDMNVAAGNRVSNQVTASTNVSLIIVVAFIVIGLATSLIIAVWMARSISKPVIAVQQAAQQLAEGDLAIYISSQDADEVGQMTNAFAAAATMMRGNIGDISRGLKEIGEGNFNISPQVEYLGEFKNIERAIMQIITSLSETLGQINEAANQVAAGSDQVSGGAQALSQGATEQASSVEELSATITEISQQVKQNANTAQTARANSERTSNEVEGSNRHMQDMIVAMNDINRKSAEIGKIIKTIDDIAFQTNILALNAAVEAARAGAAGKGFAVVADEVRNLAGKSAEAAKNTTDLIEETVQAVGNGTKIADATAKAMQSVVEGTRAVTDQILEIADASNSQASAIAQVTAGIDQISSVVQQNSATSEESAAASEELNSQANMLKQLVSQFQLLEGSGQVSLDPISEPVATRAFVTTTGASKY